MGRVPLFRGFLGPSGFGGEGGIVRLTNRLTPAGTEFFVTFRASQNANPATTRASTGSARILVFISFFLPVWVHRGRGLPR